MKINTFFAPCRVQFLAVLGSFFLSVPLTVQSQDDFTGFYLNFEESGSDDVNVVLEMIGEDEELLYDIINELNEFIELPVAVPITFVDCGVANAFYNSETQSVIMCYEMIIEAYNVYVALGMEGEDLSIAIANLTFSIMYHEIGHALVDILELPITGREEDAVDQFSVVSLLVFEELGQEALINFAQFWGGLAMSSENNLEDMSFWGEHSLSSQRFYDILCLAYGSDTENLGFLVEGGMLPEERAQRCPSEFERVANAWASLLEPFTRD